MDFIQFLPLIAIVLLFWLMILRPSQKRHKQVQDMQRSLEVGQRIMLASGIFGTITSLTDERVELEIAPDVVVEAVRGAVSSVETTAIQEQE